MTRRFCLCRNVKQLLSRRFAVSLATTQHFPPNIKRNAIDAMYNTLADERNTLLGLGSFVRVVAQDVQGRGMRRRFPDTVEPHWRNSSPRMIVIWAPSRAAEALASSVKVSVLSSLGGASTRRCVRWMPLAAQLRKCTYSPNKLSLNTTSTWSTAKVVV